MCTEHCRAIVNVHRRCIKLELRLLDSVAGPPDRDYVQGRNGSRFWNSRSRPEVNGLSVMTRSYITRIIGAGILVASFLLTLWLTEATPPKIESAPSNKEATILAGYLVPDVGILSAAAKAAGLQASDKVTGYIDEVRRLDRNEVKIRGWAVNSMGQGSPITVLVFANGKNVLETQTKGARSDVAVALQLPDADAANVGFEGALRCNPGEPLLGVAVTQSSLYAALGHAPGALVCPPG